LKEVIKILVVEDAPGDLFLIKYYLEELDPEGYIIDHVDNLKDAHDKIENNAFDIILLDLHLPDSEGLVTLKSTVEKFPNEVYIVLTGLSDEKIGLDAVKNGAQDFLVKGKISSSSLDSSIKFSYERAKLKKAVKIFGESIKVVEQLQNIRVLIIDCDNDTINHSRLLVDFLGVDTPIDSIDSLKEIADFGENIESEIKNVIKDGVYEVVGNIKGVPYVFTFSSSESLTRTVVATIVQA